MFWPTGRTPIGIRSSTRRAGGVHRRCPTTQGASAGLARRPGFVEKALTPCRASDLHGGKLSGFEAHGTAAVGKQRLPGHVVVPAPVAVDGRGPSGLGGPVICHRRRSFLRAEPPKAFLAFRKSLSARPGADCREDRGPASGRGKRRQYADTLLGIRGALCQGFLCQGSK